MNQRTPKLKKSTFIKIAISFPSIIPCLIPPSDDRLTTEKTPTQLPITPKCYLLRLLPNKVVLIPEKVVPIPKKVDYIPEIVAYPPNKKSPQKAIFLAHLEKKVYLCAAIVQQTTLCHKKHFGKYNTSTFVLMSSLASIALRRK